MRQSTISRNFLDGFHGGMNRADRLRREAADHAARERQQTSREATEALRLSLAEDELALRQREAEERAAQREAQAQMAWRQQHDRELARAEAVRNAFAAEQEKWAAEERALAAPPLGTYRRELADGGSVSYKAPVDPSTFAPPENSGFDLAKAEGEGLKQRALQLMLEREQHQQALDSGDQREGLGWFGLGKDRAARVKEIDGQLDLIDRQLNPEKYLSAEDVAALRYARENPGPEAEQIFEHLNMR